MRRFAFLMAFVLISSAKASSFVEAPFEESVSVSPVIARGTIGRSESGSGKLSDGSEVPYTYWEFKVIEVLKGTMKASGIRVRQIGGEKNGLGMTISGAAEFSPGEDVVLMLDPARSEQGDDAYTIRELSMGKYGIERDEEGKEYLVGAGIGENSDHPGHSRRHRLALNEVRKIIADQKSNPPGKPRSSPLPSATGGSGLLGDSSPTTAASPIPEAFSSESDEKKAAERTSRAWVLVVGVALGAFFYWLKKRKG